MAEINWSALGNVPNPIDQFATGYQNGMVLAQKNARRKAYNLFSTDPAAAQTALISAGDVEGANAIRARSLDEGTRQARVSAAKSYVSGDTPGAVNALADTGDLSTISAVQDQARQQHQAQAQYAAQEAVKLQQIYKTNGPEAMLAAFDANTPNYRAMGSSDQDIQTLRQGLTKNPDAVLGALVQPKHSFHTVGDNLMVTDDNTGKVIGSYQGTKFIPLKEGESLVAVGENGPNGDGQPSPAPTSAGSAAAGGQVRGVRNNNPLNITGSGWNGQTGSDGKYATFSSPEAGFAAADKNLQAYATKHGINTLSGVITRWAPPNENDTASYIATVAKDLGVDPNKPLNLADPNTRRAVLSSMSKVELGKDAGAASGASAAGLQDSGVRTAPGARVIAQGPPKPDDDAPLTPAAVELLAGKYLNNGTLPPMGMGKTGTRNRVMVLNRATELAKGLGLDANDLVAGTVTGKAAGQALGKITSLRSQVEASEQTVLKNAQFALSLAPKGGGPTGIPVLNRWIQSGQKNIAGDPDVAAFHNAIGTVADEYAKVMTASTGSGGTSSDSARQEAYRRINAAQTPQQLSAIISAMKTEMDNRVASMRETEAGLRNTVRNGGQPGGSPQPGPTPSATTVAAPAPYTPRNRKPLNQIFGGD